MLRHTVPLHKGCTCSENFLFIDKLASVNIFNRDLFEPSGKPQTHYLFF